MIKRYLSTLRDKSPEHQRRFALVTSGIITLFIFTFWSMANFGPGGVIAEKIDDSGERGPSGSLISNMASSFTALKDNFSELKDRTIDTYYGR